MVLAPSPADEKAIEALKPDGGCKRCGSDARIKWGTSRGRQRWRCKTCGLTGTENGAPPYKQRSLRLIASAHELYFDGLSLKKVARNLDKFYGVRPSKSSVWRWITTYGPLAADFVRNFHALTGPTWGADEFAFKCAWEREPNKWLWNVMDLDSRFVLSHIVTKWGREDRHAVALFREAKRASLTSPELIVTDRLPAYHAGVRRNFYAAASGRLHLDRIHLTNGKANNNVMERKWGNDRERTKVMRAFKRQGSAAAILEGLTVHRNFLQEHEAIGTTPARKAGIYLPFNDGWGDLIRWATYWNARRGLA